MSEPFLIMNLVISPQNANLQTDAPAAGREVEWMENKYRDANFKAMSAEPPVPVFEHASFLKTDLQSLLDQPNNEFVVFTHFNATLANETVSTLMAVGVSDIDLIQTNAADRILVASHFSRPKFNGPLKLIELSHPARMDKVFTWNISGHTGKTIEEIMSRLIKTSFTNGNMFASIRFHRDDLSRVMSPAGCEKVVFIPIKLECRIEESIVGVREVSFQNDVTLVASALDAGNQILPLTDQYGSAGVAFSGDGWPPNYPHWQ